MTPAALRALGIARLESAQSMTDNSATTIAILTAQCYYAAAENELGVFTIVRGIDWPEVTLNDPWPLLKHPIFSNKLWREPKP